MVDLRFEGARSFSRSELASAIAIDRTSCPLLYRVVLVCALGVGREERSLEAGDLEADELRLRVYYYERGFRHAEVSADTTRGDDGVVVTFRIVEGDPVRVRSDVVMFEAARDTLLTRLRNNGFARAEVLSGYRIDADADPYSAAVQFEVLAGTRARIGEIRVEGTEETSPELVRRMLSFREGGFYDRSALLESQRNLYRLQVYRHAEVQADLLAEPDSLVPITIRVAEGDMHGVRLGGGLNNMECGNIEGRWTSRNFLGGGRRVEVRGRVGNLFIDQCEEVPLLSEDYVSYHKLTGLAAVDFSQPWFFGPRNSVGLGVFTERRSAGCSVASINAGTCDVTMLDAGRFDVRPAGGEVLLEGNVELRFPLPVAGGKLRGAAFVDAGQVWLTASSVALDEILAMPGIGLRYHSPVGPIRIDAGFNTQGPESLPVLTTGVEECLLASGGDCQQVDGLPRQALRNTDDLVSLEHRVSHGRGLGDMQGLGDFFSRFQLHFSIGQAF